MEHHLFSSTCRSGDGEVWLPRGIDRMRKLYLREMSLSPEFRRCLDAFLRRGRELGRFAARELLARLMQISQPQTLEEKYDLQF